MKSKPIKIAPSAMTAKVDYIDYQARTQPLAYSITFRCYGTWLHVMDGFKAYATKQLRKSGLLSQNIKPWARHGSTAYLWTEEQVQNAIDLRRQWSGWAIHRRREVTEARVALPNGRASDTLPR
jgi:hypothetical protein